MPDSILRRASLVAAFAMALGGCSNDLSSLTVADFNPLKGNDPLRQADYNYFYNRQQVTTGPVTAADLVGPDGRCAFAPAPVQGYPDAAAPVPPQAPRAAEPINPGSNRALYFTAGPEANQGAAGAPGGLPPEVRNGPAGIALQMTECQVVAVAGYTDRVEVGANAGGVRETTLTYLTGPRPGIYRFRGGRLASMERVGEPAQPKKAQPKKPQRAAKAAKSQQQVQ